MAFQGIEARPGWISALPWNQAPAQLRSRAVEQLPPCSASQPGVRAAAEKMLVHGREYLCVLKYSAPFAGERLHSLTTSLSRTLQALRRLNKELHQPRTNWKREQIVRKIERRLSAPFLAEIVSCQLDEDAQGWQLPFDYDSEAFARLLRERLRRTVLLTNRLDWTAEQAAAGYGGQQSIERVFRGLKDGDRLAWEPMHHWTLSSLCISMIFRMETLQLS